MSGFDLVRVDGGGDPVHLPPGETVLGRGPLLGVSDKRVSRHHGLLENLHGHLRLKPTHINPCFVQSSLTGDPQPLQRDSWHRLYHGDVFSLLPGHYIFRVVAVGGDECTIRDRQMFEEEQLPVPAEPPAAAGQDEDIPTAAPSGLQVADRSPKQGGSARSLDDRMFRTRVLPAWMTAAALSPSSPLTAVKRSKAAAAPSSSASKKQAAPTQATPPATSLLEEEEEEEERRSRKKRRKLSDEEESPQTLTVCVAGGPVRSGESEEEEGRGRVSKPERKDVHKQTEFSGISFPASPKAQVRSPCPYGKDCYRKNPVHFQECSHPGDSDYQEEEEDDEEEDEAAAADDRPECPYGTDCYRKNPLHRKEYKHTRRPARRARPVTKTPEDDFEDDDSFINDDSEDGGDDSDYVPPDSDDSGKEDMRRLQREAKAFLQRKK